jgi:hypothetical protein
LNNGVRFLLPLFLAGALTMARGQTAQLSSNSVAFGNTVVGNTVSKNLTLSNTGSVGLSIYAMAASPNPPFRIQSNPCNGSVAPGRRCTFTIYFSPTATGTVSGTLVVSSNASSGTPCTLNSSQGYCQTVNLTGTGIAIVSLTPSSLSFGSINVGSSSSAQNVTLTNNGTARISAPSITITTNFSQTNSCAQPIRAGGKCNISVTFTPTAAGVIAGTLTVTVSGTTQTVPLGGTGVSTSTLQSITVTPANATLVAPATQQYTATGNYSDGSHQDLTGLVAWNSSNTATATISTSGLATARATGVTTISATSSGIVGSTGLTVAARTLTGIAVAPTSAAINTGDSQQFTATAKYSDGTTGSVAVTWTSSNSGTAQIDMNGLAVGDAAGQATITATSGNVNGSAALTVNASACLTNNRIDARLLVLTNGKTEADFPAITTALHYLHAPYTVFDTSTGAITSGQLYSGCHAFYSGVIVSFLNGSANPPFQGADVLAAFETTFGIRQVNWYVYPSPSLGFGWPTGAKSGDSATFTTAAATLFPYVNLSYPVVIDASAYVYLATPYDSTATPLLTDTAGNSLALIENFTDGRQYLSMTFDSNQYMTHNLVLSYGLVNWVTKGLFVGEKHIFFTPQEDDWGIDDDIWTQNSKGQYPACGTPVDQTGMTYRISGADADAFVARQNNWQANPLFTKVKLYNAFNGCGFTADSDCGSTGSPYPNDTLSPWTQNTANSAHFGWINHTYEHLNLDGQSYSADFSQISQNINMAQTMGFADFSITNMVTPDISGLNDPNALQAIVNNGVKYVVSDTSCTLGSTTCDSSVNNGPGPGFNLPIINTIQPSITEIPRRPNNLFYNVGDPGGWQNEYQCIYANQPPYSTYTAQQVMDFIAQSFVALMLQGDADPEMFHQTNLKAYDSTHSVLSNLLEDTFSLYQTYFTLPMQSMDEDKLGQFMLNNLAVDNSGVIATVNNGASRTITLKVVNAATIPVTGLQSSGAEAYGGQYISHTPMTAGETLTQPVP